MHFCKYFLISLAFLQRVCYAVFKAGDKMEINERIKHRRKELGLSAEYIAEKLGLSPATIYRYESKEIKKFPTDVLVPLAKVLHTTPEYLMGWSDSNQPKLDSPIITDNTVSFPVIGELAAGYEHIAMEDWSGETIKIPATYLKGRNREDYLVLSVKGDSMYPHYQDGDKVLILKQDCVNESGDIAAVIYDSEYATLKKVEYKKNAVRLVPLNPEYMPKEISGADLEQFKIIGIPRLLVREISD